MSIASVTNPHLNGVEVPREVFSTNVLSRLEIKELGRCACVSTNWNNLASNDNLFKELFRRVFQENPPMDIAGRKALCKRLTQISVDNKWDLYEIVMSFLCTLKGETKRRLECEFPNAPTYSLVVEQSFGPRRGTRQSFESSAAEQTEYYVYHGEDEFFQEGIANHLFFRAASENLFNIPYCRSICIESGFKKGVSYPFIHIDPIGNPSDIQLRVEGIDVGYGNTLGYFSRLNNWKNPFKLFCIDSSTWVGMLPVHSNFKFVKIDRMGKITWENNGFLTLKLRYESNRRYPNNTDIDYAHPVVIDGKDIKFPK